MFYEIILLWYTFLCGVPRRNFSGTLEYIATRCPQAALQLKNVNKTATFNTRQNTATEAVGLTPTLAQNSWKHSCELLQMSCSFLKLCFTPFHVSVCIFFFCLTFLILELCYFKGKAIFFLSVMHLNLLGLVF